MRLRFWRIGVIMTAKEVLRGRLVLLLLVLVPSLFYAVAWLTGTETEVSFQLGSIGDDVVVSVPQNAQMAVFIGLAATGLLTSFVALKLIQREADVNQRLVLCGYSAAELVAAKLTVMCGLVLAVSLYVAAVIPLVFADVERFGTLWVGFAAGGWVYGCYGLLVGALIRKELEGILFVALLTNLDSGWLQNPIWYAQAQNRAVIRMLPAHLPSQVSMAAAFTDQPIGAPLAGALVYGAALLVLAALVFTWRTRSR